MEHGAAPPYDDRRRRHVRRVGVFVARLGELFELGQKELPRQLLAGRGRYVPLDQGPHVRPVDVHRRHT